MKSLFLINYIDGACVILAGKKQKCTNLLQLHHDSNIQTPLLFAHFMMLQI